MSGEKDPNTQTPMDTDQDDSDEDQTKCPRCTQIFEPSILQVFFSEVNIEELLPHKNNNVVKPKKDEFKKLFCALLNCPEGNAVIFHVDDTRILDKYDIAWNNELMQFVPDNSCYHDIFERVILDTHHFRVRVKPRKDSKCVMSTCCFHSSLSLDKGLDKQPSHHKMQRVLENARDGHGYCNEPLKLNLPDDTSFQSGQGVQVGGYPTGIVPFQECMWLQAKRIREQLQLNDLVDMMWGTKEDNHDLGKYISAFSKVPRGGIIYFGIREKAESDTHPKLKTFFSEGVVLDQQTSDQLQQTFKEKINNLLWVRARSQSDNDQSESSPFVGGSVEVFRFPEEPQNRCIIKITVYQFQGVCFFRKEGPESYVLNAEDKPVPVKNWTDWAEGSHCEDFVPVDVYFKLEKALNSIKTPK